MTAQVLQDTLFGATVAREAVGPAVSDPIVDSRGTLHHLVADADRAIMRIEGVAAYGIERGRHVSVEPVADAPAARVAEYLNSTAAAILLGQQRRFALHANAVSVDGRAVLFAGDRGAGKSTTSLRLLQRGHRHLTDDLCLLDAEGGATVLHPARRGIRVLAATAERLGLDLSGALPTRVDDDEKLVLAQPEAAPCPVAAIVVLEHGAADRVERSAVTGADALRLMTGHAYRRAIVQLLWPGELFAWAADLVERVPVHVVRRPESAWTIDAVADAVEQVALRAHPS